MKKDSHKKCDNCHSYIKGECGGLRLCEEYQAAYIIPAEERNLWPDGRCGIHYKSDSTRIRGEFRYSKDRTCYGYGYDDYGNRSYGRWDY